MEQRFIPAANAPFEEQSKRNEQDRRDKRSSIVMKLGGALAVMSLVSLAACGASAEEPSSTQPTVSDSSSSSANETDNDKPKKTAEPTPEATAKASEVAIPDAAVPAPRNEVDSYRFGVTEEEFNALLLLSDKEFSALDIKERVKVPQYLAASIEYNTDLYVDKSNSAKDRLPKEISLNNTAQEILATIAAINREAYFRKDPNGANDFVFSPNLVRKNAAGLSIAPDSGINRATKERLDDYDRLLQSGQTEVTLSTPETAGISRFINASTAISESPVFDGLDGRKTKVVEITDGPDDEHWLFAVAFIEGLWVESPVPATAYPALVPVGG